VLVLVLVLVIVIVIVIEDAPNAATLRREKSTETRGRLLEESSVVCFDDYEHEHEHDARGATRRILNPERFHEVPSE
jgi:hypothetical protein